MTARKIRYVGLDVHKHYVMVGAVDRFQRVLMPPRKVALVELENWAQKYLQSTDQVVLEATHISTLEFASLADLKEHAAESKDEA